MSTKKRIEFLKKIANIASEENMPVSEDFDSVCKFYLHKALEYTGLLFDKIYKRERALSLKKERLESEGKKIPDDLNKEIKDLTKRLSELRTSRTPLTGIYLYFDK